MDRFDHEQLSQACFLSVQACTTSCGLKRTRATLSPMVSLAGTPLSSARPTKGPRPACSARSRKRRASNRGSRFRPRDHSRVPPRPPLAQRPALQAASPQPCSATPRPPVACLPTAASPPKPRVLQRRLGASPRTAAATTPARRQPAARRRPPLAAPRRRRRRRHPRRGQQWRTSPTPRLSSLRRVLLRQRWEGRLRRRRRYVACRPPLERRRAAAAGASAEQRCLRLRRRRRPEQTRQARPLGLLPTSRLGSMPRRCVGC
jgi:hypothetical protein